MYLIGGHAVLGEQVESELDEVGVQTLRYAGPTRYDTALEVNRLYGNEEVAPLVQDVVIVNGDRSADALAIGPLAFREHLPLLLTYSDELAPQVSIFLDEFPSTERAIVVGGRAAVDERVAEQLRARGLEVVRVAGATRTETAVAVAEFAEREYDWLPTSVVITRGDVLADGLVAASLSRRAQRPILLTERPDVAGAPMLTHLEDRSNRIAELLVLGDATAVTEGVVEEARSAATFP
jgi:putative cell wall-binding protein